jgi:hypothetical protein
VDSVYALDALSKQVVDADDSSLSLDSVSDSESNAQLGAERNSRMRTNYSRPPARRSARLNAVS